MTLPNANVGFQTEALQPQAARKSRIIKGGFLALMMLFGALSLYEMWVSAHFAYVLKLAEALELDKGVTDKTVTAFVPEVTEIVDKGYCRSDIVEAGATVILFDLDQQNAIKNYDAWATAVMAGDRYFMHAIACTPRNANNWLRLAMIRQASAEVPDEMARLMSRAESLAPSDQDAIIARLHLWNKVSTKTLQRSSIAVNRDVSTFLNHAPPTLVTERLQSVGPALQAVFAGQMALMHGQDRPVQKQSRLPSEQLLLP